MGLACLHLLLFYKVCSGLQLLCPKRAQGCKCPESRMQLQCNHPHKTNCMRRKLGAGDSAHCPGGHLRWTYSASIPYPANPRTQGRLSGMSGQACRCLRGSTVQGLVARGLGRQCAFKPAEQGPESDRKEGRTQIYELLVSC